MMSDEVMIRLEVVRHQVMIDQLIIMQGSIDELCHDRMALNESLY